MAVKLCPKKRDGGYTTSYLINIGSKEAREAGFLNEDGTSKILEKTVDSKGKRIILYLKEEENP